MNLLWITNIMLPPIIDAMNFPKISTGGWMYSSLQQIKESWDGKIAVATVYGGDTLIEKDIDGIVYYLLPLRGKSKLRYNSNLEAYWKKIAGSVRPDVVHIHGSEYPHGLAYVKACGNKGVVVSIQGLVSVCSRYLKTGIDDLSKLRFLTVRDIIRRDNFLLNNQFSGTSLYEEELLRKVNNIIGRTEWDKNHTWAFNPDSTYYYCGETLRDSFYNHYWNYQECEPHSIFVSQAGYPIKGLHILLKAIPLVLRDFPDTKIYIGGNNVIDRPWWKISGYAKYIKFLIAKYKLEEHIKFTGVLTEEEMCRRYLRSNVFVCCSSLENSPNSLGEAQMLGVPYIASYVGGVPEIVDNNPDVLYRYEEYEMLAQKIVSIFKQKENIKKCSFDEKRYDKELNRDTLIKIYSDIFRNG